MSRASLTMAALTGLLFLGRDALAVTCYSSWSPATQDDGKTTIVTHWPAVFMGGEACADAQYGSGANSATLSVYETHSELNFWGRERIKCLNDSSYHYTAWAQAVEHEWVDDAVSCGSLGYIDYAQAQGFYSYDCPDGCVFQSWLSTNETACH